MGQWPSPVTITVADGELYNAALTLFVTITTPAEGATVATAAVPVQWAFAPGTQQTYRVRVWSDASLTTLVYDSGVVTSATKAATLPEGSLASGGTFYMVVDITTTDGQSGSSGTRTFATSYLPANTIPAPTIVEYGDCPTFATADLPSVKVNIPTATLGANEVFTRYSIWRRVRDGSDPSATWERIGSETNRLATSFLDTTLPLYKVVEYDVTFSVHNTSSGFDLSSAHHTTVPYAYLDNPFTYLHDPSDPTGFAVYYQFEGSIDPVDDIEEALFWGNAEPVLFIGDASYDRVNLPGLPDVNRGELWSKLQTLRAAQRTSGAVLCLRIGEQGKKYFCGLTRASEQLSQGQYVPTLDLVEVKHSEAVA